MDEKELVHNLLEGDPKAQKQFFDAYHQRLYRTAVHFLGYQDPEAEDVVQETFLRAHRHLERFDFQAAIYTWLNKICVNLCYTRLQTRQRNMASSEEQMEVAVQMLSQKNAVKAEEDTDNQSRLELVRNKLKLLDKKCQQIIDLRDFQGLSYIEMVKVVKVPIGTVFSRVARCRELLKKKVLNSLKDERS